MKQLKKLNPELEEALKFMEGKEVTMDLSGSIGMMQFFSNFVWNLDGKEKDSLSMITFPEEFNVSIDITLIKRVEIADKFKEIQNILFYMKDGSVFQARLEV
jgi:hypothetical protein